MVMVPFALLALLAAGILTVRRLRAQALAGLRARWGQPTDGQRRMDAMAASHASRLTHLGSTASLDTRTWADLNLDAVFATVDRTSSTLGQHALYHRLRTAPRADHLDEFERLVTRFGRRRRYARTCPDRVVAAARSTGLRPVVAGSSDAVDTRGWYAIFPCLTADDAPPDRRRPQFAPVTALRS